MLIEMAIKYVLVITAAVGVANLIRADVIEILTAALRPMQIVTGGF